jgi:hypothetical protein
MNPRTGYSSFIVIFLHKPFGNVIAFKVKKFSSGTVKI